MAKIYKDHELFEEIYKQSKKFVIYTSAVASTLFFVALIVYFPLMHLINTNLKSSLSNSSCPISYSDIKVSYIPMRFTLENLKISPQCLSTPSSIEFKTLPLSINFPEIMSFSLKATLDVTIDKNVVPIIFLASPFEQHVIIENRSIDLGIITQMLGSKLKFNGRAIINLNVTTKGDKLIGYGLNLKSQSLTLQPADLEGFKISNTPFGSVSIDIETKANNMEVKSARIGKPGASLFFDLKGKIIKSPLGLGQSKIDLKGMIGVTEDFYEKNAYLNLFLQGIDQFKTPKTGKISGLFSSMQLN